MLEVLDTTLWNLGVRPIPSATHHSSRGPRWTMLLSWRPRYSELRPQVAVKSITICKEDSLWWCSVVQSWWFWNSYLQEWGPTFIFSMDFHVVLHLFWGGLGFTRKNCATSPSIWISQISSAGSNNFTNLKISCLSFATLLVVLMEGLGWEPRRYDLVGGWVGKGWGKKDILLNWSSAWRNRDAKKNKLNFFLRNLRFYKFVNCN